MTDNGETTRSIASKLNDIGDYMTTKDQHGDIFDRLDIGHDICQINQKSRLNILKKIIWNKKKKFNIVLDYTHRRDCHSWDVYHTVDITLDY